MSGHFTYGDENNLKLTIVLALAFKNSDGLKETKIYSGGNNGDEHPGKIYVSCDFNGYLPKSEFDEIMKKVKIDIDIEEISKETVIQKVWKIIVKK